MVEPALRRTWSFGSFVHVRSFPRLFADSRVGEVDARKTEAVVVPIDAQPIGEDAQRRAAAVKGRRSA
jgi:hypothetical protein